MVITGMTIFSSYPIKMTCVFFFRAKFLVIVPDLVPKQRVSAPRSVIIHTETCKENRSTHGKIRVCTLVGGEFLIR